MALLLPNSVFLPIPRTGGTWIYRVAEYHAEHCGWKNHVIHSYNKYTSAAVRKRENTGHCWISWHEGSRRFRDPRFPKKKPAFCFVRHPLSWYRSMWIYKACLDGGWSMRNNFERSYVKRMRSKRIPFAGKACLDSQVSFEAFLKEALRYKGGYLNMLYRNFTKDCKHIGKLENFADDFERIMLEVGENIDLDYIRSKKPVNAAGGLPDFKNKFRIPLKTARRLMKHDEWAVKTFGYNYIPEGIVRDET